MSKIKKEELENEEKFVDIPAEDLPENEDDIDETPKTEAKDEDKPKRRNFFQWAGSKLTEKGDKLAETDWHKVGKRVALGALGLTAVAGALGALYCIITKKNDEEDVCDGEIPMLPDSDNIDDIQATETWDNDDDSELTSTDDETVNEE